MKVTLQGGFVKEGDDDMFVAPFFDSVELSDGDTGVCFSAMDVLEVINQLIKQIPDGFDVEDVILNVLIED